MSSRGLVVVLAWSALTAPAHAHLGHSITSAERYLKLDVSGREARVVASLSLGPGEGLRVLRAADTDTNGEVSEAERDAYLAAWAEGLAGELPVFVDGERVPLVWGEPYLEPAGPVRAVPVTVELVAHFTLGGGRETVRIEDRMIRREVYERTDVAFRARDGAQIVASGVGDEVTEPTADLAYTSARAEPVVLTAIVDSPEAAATLPWWAIAGGVLAIALIAAALVWLRAGRGSSR